MSDKIKFGFTNGTLTELNSVSNEPGIYLWPAPPQEPGCTLSDEDLICKANELLNKLIETGGKSFEMHIPARPNDDLDLIFAELIHRFKNLKEEMSHVDIDPQNSY